MQTTTQKTIIAFLHSSAMPIEAVNAQAREIAPAAKLMHVVREDIACMLEAHGVTPLIEMMVREALQALADRGAQIIVCTCPRLGALIEAGAQDLREEVGVPVFSARMGAEAALKLAAA